MVKGQIVIDNLALDALLDGLQPVAKRFQALGGRTIVDENNLDMPRKGLLGDRPHGPERQLSLVAEGNDYRYTTRR